MDKFLEDVKTYEKSIRKYYKLRICLSMGMGVLFFSIIAMILILMEKNVQFIQNGINNHQIVCAFFGAIFLLTGYFLMYHLPIHLMENRMNSISNYATNSQFLPKELRVEVYKYRMCDGDNIYNTLNICENETNCLMNQIHILSDGRIIQ